jgi:hypothetical protein
VERATSQRAQTLQAWNRRVRTSSEGTSVFLKHGYKDDVFASTTTSRRVRYCGIGDAGKGSRTSYGRYTRWKRDQRGASCELSLLAMYWRISEGEEDEGAYADDG